MDIAKFAEIVNILSNSLNPECKIKIAMLADTYYESVKENYQLIEEISKKNSEIRDNEEEIKRLNAIIKRKEQLIRKGKAYYYQEPEGGISGPVCPNCYTKNNIVNFLTTGSNGAHCSICKCSYPDVNTNIKGKSSRIIKGD